MTVRASADRLFLRPSFHGALGRLGPVGMILADVLYYACSARYFGSGWRYSLLFAPALGIPVLMTLAAVLFLLFASALLTSPYLLVAD